MTDRPARTPDRAASVEPETIELRLPCMPGVELLRRRRPPGAVQLDAGHREHLLICNVAEPDPGQRPRSILRGPDGVREWRRLPKGEVSFIPAGMPIDWEWTYRSASVHLILEPQVVQRLRDDCGMTGPLRPMLREFNEPLRHLLQQLGDEAAARRQGHELALSSLAGLAALTVLRSCAEPNPSVRENAPGLSACELRRALDLLEDRLAEKVTLRELAIECGVSTWHFARAFKRAVGHPPHEYQIRRRVERARELLTASPRPSVVEVAARLGFADESHLRRHFKRIQGVTPGRYRA